MPVRIVPAVGVPAAGDDQEWASLVKNQLTDVRKCAENWRNGLVALIGLVATFSVVKGANDLSGLVQWAAYSVGALLALALVCSIVGAWKSLAAAYGTPAVITFEEFQNLGGATGYHLDLGMKTISNLRWARWATIATLILVAIAVALTWYGPRSASATLSVERKGLPGVCGKFVSSKDGDIEIKPTAAQPVRIHMSDVTAVRAVSECP